MYITRNDTVSFPHNNQNEFGIVDGFEPRKQLVTIFIGNCDEDREDDDMYIEVELDKVELVENV